MFGAQVAANRSMEAGNLSEFQGFADPAAFRAALADLTRSLDGIDQALADYDDLLLIAGGSEALPEFQVTLQANLAQVPSFHRLTASQLGPHGLTTLSQILSAQRDDLVHLRALTERILGEFHAVVPKTESGEFVETMLAGQAPFAALYEELVGARTDFQHFYTRSCMTTIDAVMQIYPAGFAFVSGTKQPRPVVDSPPTVPLSEDEASTEWEWSNWATLLFILGVIGWLVAFRRRAA